MFNNSRECRIEITRFYFRYSIIVDIDAMQCNAGVYILIFVQPVVSMKFLGDEETVRKAIESVAAQGKAK